MLECEGRGLYVADEVLRPMASPHAQMFSLSVGRLKSGHSSTCFGVEEHLCDKLDSEFSVDGGCLGSPCWYLGQCIWFCSIVPKHVQAVVAE